MYDINIRINDREEHVKIIGGKVEVMTALTHLFERFIAGNIFTSNELHLMADLAATGNDLRHISDSIEEQIDKIIREAKERGNK